MNEPDPSADAALTSIEAVNLTEAQGRTLQREIILTSVDIAKSNAVRGFVSLDDLNRSLSADPLTNLFGLDRKLYPTGHGGFLPRRLMYFVPGTPAIGIAGREHYVPARPWRMVVVTMEHEYPELLPHVLEVPGAGRIKADDVAGRSGDLVRYDLPLDGSDVAFLEKHNFQVLPADPIRLFKEARASAKVLDALRRYPVMPESFFRNRAGFAVTSTDWNKPLSARPFKGMSQHILKGRNTNVSAAAGFIDEFGVTLAHDARLISRHREIFIPYENMTTVAMLAPGAGEGAAATRSYDFVALLRKEHPDLSRVLSTTTRFSPPRTYVTFEQIGRFDARSRALVPVSHRLVLPSGPRSFSVVAADGTVRAVKTDYRAELSAIMPEVEAIEASWAEALAAEIMRVLRRLRVRG